MQREESICPFFEYELTTIPTALFKDNIMRRTDKSPLGRALKDGIQPCESLEEQGMFVLDGGSLLHRMKWSKNATYKELAMQYVHYVQLKYGNAFVVFDGHGPSLKDHEHQRRVKKISAEIQLQESMEARVNQQAFLGNEKNKSQFIQLLCKYLEANSYVTKQSRDDADCMIVKCALQLATEGNVVTVVAEDTDILVLLMYHWNMSLADIYLKSEARSQKKEFHLWKIQDLVATAGDVVISNLLFIHAWSGCDTTCATFGHGRILFLKKMRESAELQEISKIISNSNATAEEVGQAGIQAFIVLYGGKKK